MIYQEHFKLWDLCVQQSRQIYDFVALIGDLGGIIECFMIGLGFIFFTYSDFQYKYMSVKRMFLARTSNEKMFDDSEDKFMQKQLTQDMDLKVQQEIEKHRVPRLTRKDKICLLISTIMGSCFPKMCWSKHKKLVKFYNEGETRIENELNIVKIIKTLRMVRIFLKNSFLTPEVKFGIRHAEQNFVNIDLSDEDSDQEGNQQF